MPYRIEEIEGIGPAYAEKLRMAQIRDTDGLLQHCGDANGRRRTSQLTGIGESMLLRWTNLADLMRVSGIGKQYSELLEAAGVDTVRELATRNAANLAQRMIEVNQERKLARATPSPTVVQGWIEHAGRLEPRVTY